MKSTELEQLVKMDPKKLLAELKSLQEELFKHAYEVRTGQNKDSHLVRDYKKRIARIKTILHSQK
jgi:ribosomal protein L29